jgi:hypothetical protein
MQYSECGKCIHNGNMCKFLIVEALLASINLESLTNRSLQYMRYKPKEKISISLDFKCNGFVPKSEV